MNPTLIYRSLLCLLLAGCYVDAEGQERQSMPYQVFGVSDGLAQMQVRAIHIDGHGHVWIGTQGGISVYDGSQVYSLDISGAIADDHVVAFVGTGNWLYGNTIGETFKYNGDTTIILDFPKETMSTPRLLQQDSLGQIWVRDLFTLYLLENDTLVPASTRYPSLRNLDLYSLIGDPKSSRLYLFTKDKVVYSLDIVTGQLKEVRTALQGRKIRQFWVESTDEKQLYYSTMSDDFLVDTIYAISPENVVPVIARSGSEYNILGERTPIAFLDGYGSQSVLYVKYDNSYLPFSELNAAHIRHFRVDENRIYAATDLGFVVIHANGLSNIDTGPCNYPWSAVPVDSSLFVGCYQAGVIELGTDGSLIKVNAFPERLNARHEGAQILSNYAKGTSEILFGSLDGFYKFSLTGQSLGYIPSKPSVEAMAFDETSGNYIIASDKIVHYDPGTGILSDTITVDPGILGYNTINDLELTPTGMWAAGTGGIQYWRRGTAITDTFTTANNRLPCSGAVAILDAHGSIWAGGTCGLLILKDSTFVRVLPDRINNRVNQLTALPKDRLMCVSQNDAFILDISSEPPDLVYHFSDLNGLNLQEPSENGSSLQLERYVWMPSVNGLQRIDLDKVQPAPTYSRILILAVNGSSNPSLFDPGECIKNNASSVRLLLSAPNYSGDDFRYRYRHGTLWSPWQNSPELVITGLDHGVNDVRIQIAADISEPEEYLEVNYCVEAHVPFLRRQSTALGLGILVLTLMGGVIIAGYRERRQAKRIDKLNSELALNRLRSIQAYFNPHFLFNTLSSLQDTIHRQDTRASSEIVAKLSRMFRSLLDAGTGSLRRAHPIPLVQVSKELELIRDFVELQNLQRQYPVHFEMRVNPEVEKFDPLIPPLLVQPFIENAFKHAFPAGQNDKRIIVDVAKMSDQLVITIADNGSGFDISEVREQTQSLGFLLAKERMTILNQLKMKNKITTRRRDDHHTEVYIEIDIVT